MDKIKLTFDDMNHDDFWEHFEEVCIIADILYANGYEISDKDAYRAWLAGGDGVWEHPYDYEDQQIVDEVLKVTIMEFDEKSGVPTPPFSEEYEVRALSDEEWDDIFNSMQEDFEDYEPKYEPRIEGAPWVSEGDSADSLEEAVFH
jgi:hypothetical protein